MDSQRLNPRTVIPAHAGIQASLYSDCAWTPAFAGVTTDVRRSI